MLTGTKDGYADKAVSGNWELISPIGKGRCDRPEITPGLGRRL